MSCAAASRRHPFVDIVKRSSTIVILMVLGVFVVLPLPAYAVDEVVTVTVRDGLPSALTVDPLPLSGVVHTSTVTITGTIHNITQIMVYIDGVLYTTIPTTVGQSTYTMTIVVDPGTHEVKLLGIDAYSASQIETILTVKYVPQGNGTPTNSPGQQAAHTLQTASQAAGQLRRQTGEQIDKASTYGPMKVMTDAAYGMLTTLGFISVRDGFGATNPMLWRFVVMSVGMALLVFPWVVYLVLHRLKLLPLAKRSAKNTLPVRIIGLILLLAPLLFFV